MPRDTSHRGPAAAPRVMAVQADQVPGPSPLRNRACFAGRGDPARFSFRALASAPPYWRERQCVGVQRRIAQPLPLRFGGLRRVKGNSWSFNETFTVRIQRLRAQRETPCALPRARPSPTVAHGGSPHAVPEDVGAPASAVRSGESFVLRSAQGDSCIEQRAPDATSEGLRGHHPNRPPCASGRRWLSRKTRAGREYNLP